MKKLIGLNEKSVSGLVLSAIFGLIFGSYLNKIVLWALPPSVVKEFFTNAISFGLGHGSNGMFLDLSAVKLQFGVSFEFSFLSLVGIGIAVYIFRWYS